MCQGRDGSAVKTEIPIFAVEVDGIVIVVPVVTLIAGVVIRLLVARYFALLSDRSALLLNFVDTGAVAKFGVEK